MVGQRAFFRCNTGFVLIGISIVTCGDTGQWSSAFPTCECECPLPHFSDFVVATFSSAELKTIDGLTNMYVKCPLPRFVSWAAALACSSEFLVIDFGVARGGTGTIGDTVTYQCFRGYELSGSTTLTCLDSGQWDGQKPSCTRE